MSLTVQYIIIAIIFILAVISVIKKFIPSKSKPQGGCSKDCGCELDQTSIK